MKEIILKIKKYLNKHKGLLVIITCIMIFSLVIYFGSLVIMKPTYSYDGPLLNSSYYNCTANRDPNCLASCGQGACLDTSECPLTGTYSCTCKYSSKTVCQNAVGKVCEQTTAGTSGLFGTGTLTCYIPTSKSLSSETVNCGCYCNSSNDCKSFSDTATYDSSNIVDRTTSITNVLATCAKRAENAGYTTRKGDTCTNSSSCYYCTVRGTKANVWTTSEGAARQSFYDKGYTASDVSGCSRDDSITNSLKCTNSLSGPATVNSPSTSSGVASKPASDSPSSSIATSGTYTIKFYKSGNLVDTQKCTYDGNTKKCKTGDVKNPTGDTYHLTNCSGESVDISNYVFTANTNLYTCITEISQNPKTGTVAIIIAWIVGIIAIGYAFWYFKKVGKINY